MNKLKPCPLCKSAWLYSSVGDFGSAYEYLGFRINCLCGYAMKEIDWNETKEKAIEAWNRRVGEAE